MERVIAACKKGFKHMQHDIVLFREHNISMTTINLSLIFMATINLIVLTIKVTSFKIYSRAAVTPVSVCP